MKSLVKALITKNTIKNVRKKSEYFIIVPDNPKDAEFLMIDCNDIEMMVGSKRVYLLNTYYLDRISYDLEFPEKNFWYVPKKEMSVDYILEVLDYIDNYENSDWKHYFEKIEYKDIKELR